MELVLDRKLSERRVFPAIDIIKSGTRREEKLLTKEEMEAVYTLRRISSRQSSVDMTESVIDLMKKSKNNAEFVSRLPIMEKSFMDNGRN